MKNISNMVEVFKAYTEELDRRLSILDKRVKEEYKRYDQYVGCFIRQTSLVGDLYNREGYSFMDGQFCGIDDCYEDTGVYEIDDKYKWILEDDWEDTLEVKLAEMVGRAIESGAKEGERIRERRLKDAIELIQQSGLEVIKP